jgi:hypothetical protein
LAGGLYQFKQELLEPGDAPKIGFGHRKVDLVVSELCPGQEKQTDRQTAGQSGDNMLTLPGA